MLSQPPKDGAMYGIFRESTNFMVVSMSPSICIIKQYINYRKKEYWTWSNGNMLTEEKYQQCSPQNLLPHQNQSFASWQGHVQDDLARLDNRHAPPANNYATIISINRYKMLKLKTICYYRDASTKYSSTVYIFIIDIKE